MSAEEIRISNNGYTCVAFFTAKAMERALFRWCYLGFLVLCLAHVPVRAEAFGNNALTIPKIGMSVFDTVPLNPKPWGLGHQWVLGTSYMQAINYKWFWVIEASVGLGELTNASNFVGAFYGGTGLRLNIFDDDFRPHVGTTVHYVHFLGDGADALPLNLGWPIFIGLKPYMGMEWVFYSEMSLLIDVGYGLYVNINEPFRQILHASMAFAMYF